MSQQKYLRATLSLYLQTLSRFLVFYTRQSSTKKSTRQGALKKVTENLVYTTNAQRPILQNLPGFYAQLQNHKKG